MAFITKKTKLLKIFFDCFCDDCGHEFKTFQEPGFFSACPHCKLKGFVNFRKIDTKEEAIQTF